jgi:hypothetical protein
MTRDLKPLWFSLAFMGLSGGLYWLGTVMLGR